VHESQFMLYENQIIIFTGPLDNFYLFNTTSQLWTEKHGVLKGDSSPARYSYKFVAFSLWS
jgi:hypothetical protein